MDYRTRDVYYRIALMKLADYRLDGDFMGISFDSDYKVRNFRRDIKEYGPEDHLQERAELKRELDKLQRDGMVPVYVWSRDCDQCEGDSVTLVPANVMAYNRFENRQFRYAEGPMSVYPISFEEYEKFTPYSRDRRAEQYNY